MNLLLVTSSFPTHPGDIAAPFVPPLVDELRARGDNVWVLTPTKQNAPVGWNRDETVFWFPWQAGSERLVNLNPRSPRDAWRMWNLMRSGERALLNLVRAKKIDACVGLWAVPGGYLAWQAKKKLGVPFGVWALGSDINTWANYPVIGSIIRATLRNADAVFADGFELARKTQALAQQPCHFLSSMRPLPFEQAQSVTLGKQPYHFVFVGRWEKVKGVDVLIDAARIAAETLGRNIFEVVLVGGGVLDAELRATIAQHNLNDLIRLVIQPSFPELLGYFKQASCVVIPSRNESIPLVFGEALQAGAPLIVSDVGDMGNLAREYQVARVVPPDDARALAGALCEFVANSAQTGARRAELVQLLDLKTSARLMREKMHAAL